MTNYILAYHGGSAPQTPEKTAKVMSKWNAWFESIGPSVVDGGNPVGKSQTVNSDKSVSNDGGSNPFSGYSACCFRGVTPRVPCK